MRLPCQSLPKGAGIHLLLLLLLSPLYMLAQSPLVTGTVKDSTGHPMAGISVSVKGKKIVTSTRPDGTFAISAQKSDVLVFSGVSLDVQEVALDGSSSIDVTMRSTALVMTDIVVVGYGKTSRKSLTSAITTIKPEEMNKGSISDVGQLLQGKVPGLNITASGDPNRPAAVVLRGASTINSPSGPFYVIDGVPGVDISLIAPADIASIDVLKDAAATAIYGNRASNGIIMVTTRRGKKGQAQVSYDGFVGVEKVSRRLDVMDAGQLRDFLSKNNLAFTPADDKGANTDWQKATQRSSAVSTSHNIFLGGGGDHGSYSASLNYFSKPGILLNSNLQRIIARLSVEQYLINDKLRLGLNITNSSNEADDIPYRNTVLLQSATYLPVSPVKNDNGTYFENFTKSGYYNPVAMMNHSQQNNKYNNLMAQLTAQAKLPFGLTYDLNLAYLNNSNVYGSYLDKYFTSNYNGMYDNPDPTTAGHLQQAFGTNGQANRQSYRNTSKILETYFTWDKAFGNSAINAVLGYSWQENENGDGFQVTTYNFPVDNISYQNLALSNPYAYSTRINFGADGVYQKTRLISDFARLKYTYNDRYILQASVRRDGSSVFGANNYWGYFPSVAVAWRITEEDFMKSQHLFSDLKLRASYGVTGNAFGFNAYTAQFLMGSQGTWYYNGTPAAAYGPLNAYNPDLQWEEVATTNIGADFTILKGKLGGSIDVYKRKTTDMIFPYKVDPMLVPNGTITANGGSIENKGIELALTANIISNSKFSWTSNLNLAHNKNEITSLKNPLFAGGDSTAVGFPEGAGQSGNSLELLKEGRPLGQFYSLEYAGKDASGVSQFVAGDGKTLTTSPLRGTDYHYLGNAQPKLLLGWTNTFRYSDWDFRFAIRGVFGNKIFNATRADLFRPNTAQFTNILVDAANESTADFNAYRYSSRFIESGSYVRFDNATLGYNFKHISNYIKSLRLYATANNLFVITNFTGIDPEVNQGGIAPGIDYNNFYPKTRTFLFGATVNF
ncbi:SusC/RagA family TonB-linked outer membrane protein [Niastella yeongjuensis]|uniref:SusC/RagA family TonB-linked outer membrane protein n=1 Tax=Niastella yeongjuensis TaxID=354355 RepID=A0A1V9EP81_9BACT|nr:SusC/RagA family TonB-linked outer membrane protein [Niastella yeongjuensis]OQP47744.1 SusC/RagA family TonB-linked outer membrane protein [Niastella yeongjuensis]SEP45565.1 iron complex outermembrane recepter protein [Niastella yeongjuensis]